ncbi:MAG: NAD(P)/FAD-dependent oxidoreductase [Flavobacteriales bacterium]|nr:MAG: NAD(P)/FAD-dependent oxidoreductase [Flavobacteriales bacterium]
MAETPCGRRHFQLPHFVAVGISSPYNHYQMNHPVVIIGGGLAGLSTSILLARANVPVILIEKDTYPRQKVCGEYISIESEKFVNQLGVETSTLPHIHTLHLSSFSGKMARLPLSPGGFGISRQYLDHQLSIIAKQAGVELLTGIRVKSIEDNHVQLLSGETIEASLVLGAYGRSNPLSGLKIPKNQKQYIGIKYHVRSSAPADVIEMHVFKGGYCGFSKVENEVYCLCYLGTADDLKAYRGDIANYEAGILHQNPHLRARLLEVEKITPPITTSQFHFQVHRGDHRGHLLLGDATGFIPPITGNGMSLAFRSAAQTAPQIIDFYQGRKTKADIFRQQDAYINHYAKGRIRSGVFLQNLLLKQNYISDNLLFFGLNHFPFMGDILTGKAVGAPIMYPQ